MKQIEVIYNVVRNDEVVLEGCAQVNLTDKNVKQVSEYILADKDHQTGELQDIPSEVFDRIFFQIQEDAIRHAKECDGIYPDDVFHLERYLPVSLVELLPEEILELLPDELFDYGEEEVEECKFDMDVTDMFLIRGRGLVLYGIVNGGHCQVGDKLTLLHEENDIIGETQLVGIEKGGQLIDNLDDEEDTLGLEIGLLTTLKTRKEGTGVSAVIVR